MVVTKSSPVRLTCSQMAFDRPRASPFIGPWRVYDPGLFGTASVNQTMFGSGMPSSRAALAAASPVRSTTTEDRVRWQPKQMTHPDHGNGSSADLSEKLVNVGEHLLDISARERIVVFAATDRIGKIHIIREVRRH
jgi:hypothetical protein